MRHTAFLLVLASLVCAVAGASAEVCNGHVEALPFDVAPPAPPQTYDPPVEAIPVSSTAELQELLEYNPATNGTPMDIVLSNGTYTAEGLDGDFLTLYGSHRLWAESLGKVRLTFGIHIGAPSGEALAGGAELHGLHIDISDELHGAVSSPAHRSFGVLTWGTARGVKIEDCIIEGGNAVDFGIGAYRSDGLEVRRVVIRNFKRFGLFTAIEENHPWTGHSVIEDIEVSHVGDNAWAWSFPPEHEDHDPAYPDYDSEDPYTPSQEVGIWMGAPGRLSRAKVRDIARVGIIAAGRAFGVIMEDLDVDQIGWRDTGTSSVNGAGLYFDNQAYHSTFRRFCVGSEVVKGLVSEWDNDDFPRGIRNRVEDGLIEAQWLGIFFDQGTVDSTVARVYFRNCSWAGLTFYNNTWFGDDRSTIEVLYRDIFDHGLALGACLVTAHHYNNGLPCELPPPDPQNP